MTSGGFLGPGGVPGPVHAAASRALVDAARARSGALSPDAAHALADERSLRRLRRRLTWWRLLRRVR